MKFYPRPSPVAEDRKKYFMIPIPQISHAATRRISLTIAIVLLTNLLTHYWLRTPKNTEYRPRLNHHTNQSLYLLDKARPKLQYPENFALKVREIAQKLHVPPSWLMAVMYAESGFDAAVFNRKGSGAVGLIQFMPTTAKELSVPVSSLSYMSATDQLEYVFRYFKMVRERYGDYTSLTDFYLAVLYPKARQQGPCYTLYVKPSKAYKQNQGLDENRDGSVTVSDIEQRMSRLFPQAYHDSLVKKR